MTRPKMLSDARARVFKPKHIIQHTVKTKVAWTLALNFLTCPVLVIPAGELLEMRLVEVRL